MPARAADDFAERHLRWNVIALGLDYGLFMVGLALMSTATILPAFAESLGASSVLIGAIPAVMTLGWFLPPLFAAAHTERLPYKLPFVLKWTGWERVPFLGLALIAFFLAERAPRLSMWLVLAMLLVMTAFGGMLMPAWTDLVARVLPGRLRGRFFGFANVFGTLGGLAGSALTAWALRTLPASTAYGVCFLAASVFVGLSWVALMVVREPPPTGEPAKADFWTHLRGVPALLRRDTNFRWYLVGRALMLCSVVGSGFFTVYALRVLSAPPADVALYTALMLGGQIVGQLVLGWVGDHAGHRIVMVVAACAAAVMNVVALAAGTPHAFGAVFAVNGLFNAALQVSVLNMVFDLAPTPAQNPTYVGIEKTFLAPFGFALPLLGGLLVDAAGYPLVFGIGLAASLACGAVLLVRVRDPRRSRYGAVPALRRSAEAPE
ncbi:MAG: MFS transporter [Candidatus Rokubacteria bacterium]|nr:MFS transporter [Candidatus Rokubacteria bacterium]